MNQSHVDSSLPFSSSMMMTLIVSGSMIKVLSRFRIMLSTQLNISSSSAMLSITIGIVKILMYSSGRNIMDVLIDS